MLKFSGMNFKIFLVLKLIFILKIKFMSMFTCSTELFIIENEISILITVSDYDDVSELYCLNRTYENDQSYFISLIPRKPIIYVHNNYFSRDQLFGLSLIGFKGFLSTPANLTNNLDIDRSIITYSNFILYDKNTYISCSSLSNNTDHYNFEIFLSKTHIFSTGIKYEKEYCIEMFKKANVQILEFKDISHTFIRSNNFKFIKMNTTSSNNFIYEMETLLIIAFNVQLSKNLLSLSCSIIQILLQLLECLVPSMMMSLIHLSIFKDFF